MSTNADVNNAATSSDAAIDAALAIDAGGNITSADVSVSSSTPGSRASQAPADSSPKDAPAEQAPTRVEEQAQPGESKNVQRRFKEITAQKKQAQERALQAEIRAEKLARDLAMLEERFTSKERRLTEIDNLDPRDEQIEKLSYEMKKQRGEREFEKTVQERIQQAALQERVSSITERILEETDQALDKYPLHEDRDLAKKLMAALIQGSQGEVRPIELARQWHESQLARLEPVVLEKYKGRLSAPTPVSPTGSRPLKSGKISLDETIELMDKHFHGGEWV